MRRDVHLYINDIMDSVQKIVEYSERVNGECHGYISTGRNSAGGTIQWWNGVVLEILNTETDGFIEE